MADCAQSDVIIDTLIERLDQAVDGNDETSKERVSEILKLENQLKGDERERFKNVKHNQCLKAIRLRSLELLQLLFSKDHMLSRDDFVEEFVCCAIQADFLEGLNFLIDNGLKLESDPGNRKWVALFIAVKYSNLRIVDFLLKKQQNHVHSTVRGMTLVGQACCAGNFKVLKLVLNSTATFDLNKVDSEQWPLTPLQWCFKQDLNNPDLLDCVKILIENGADINIKDSRTGQTALLTAANYHVLDVVKYLIENGADLTSYDAINNTALHYLCQSTSTTEDFLDCIKRFVEKIDIGKHFQILDSKNDRDETPLYSAVLSGNEKVVDILVEAGCDVNVNCYETLLSAAIRIKDRKMLTNDTVAKLITAGSNVNASDKYGITPLMLAVSLRDLDSIKLLIQHGADLHLKDCKGDSILDYCSKHLKSSYTASETDVLEFLKTVEVQDQGHSGENL